MSSTTLMRPRVTIVVYYYVAFGACEDVQCRVLDLLNTSSHTVWYLMIANAFKVHNLVYNKSGNTAIYVSVHT